MGFFDWLRGNDLNEEKIVRPAPEEKDRQVVDDDILKSFKEANLQDLAEFINKLMEVTKDKRNLYEQYDKMALDSLVSGAMKILSDDVVKKDLIRDKRFWAEPVVNSSERGQEIVDKVNDFLTDFNMDSKAWGYAYRLLKYGQVYLKTYEEEFEKGEIEEEFKNRRGTLFELVADPSDIITLEKYGTHVGYGVQQRDKDNNPTQGYKIVDTKQYIHIVQDQKMLRQKITLTYRKANADQDTTETFDSVIGTSYLEDAREAWSILDLIETLMLYVRYNMSDMFRIATVEVGNASRAEATRILRDTKRTMNNQDAMNMKENTYAGYHKPIPHGGMIYSAVRQGKGAITIQNIGGDIDIKSITDMDYWRDKEIAALAVPKAYLGLDDGNLTGLNNQSLTRQDIRYCRTVEAEKEPLKVGIKAICDYYLECNGLGNYIDDYEIKGATILSAETTDRMEDIEARVELANTLKDFMSQVKTIDMEKAIKIIVRKILDLESVDPEFDDIWAGKVDTQDPDEAEDVEQSTPDAEPDAEINNNITTSAAETEEPEVPEGPTEGPDTQEPEPMGPGAPV